jgi:hypothetical protein
MDLRKRGCEVVKMGGDKNGSESSPVVGFGINGVESSGFNYQREGVSIFSI